VLEDSLAIQMAEGNFPKSHYSKSYVTLSGGAEKLAYYASLGMQNQDGVLKNSNMKRYTGRINVTQKCGTIDYG